MKLARIETYKSKQKSNSSHISQWAIPFNSCTPPLLKGFLRIYPLRKRRSKCRPSYPLGKTTILFKDQRGRLAYPLGNYPYLSLPSPKNSCTFNRGGAAIKWNGPMRGTRETTRSKVKASFTFKYIVYIPVFGRFGFLRPSTSPPSSNSFSKTSLAVKFDVRGLFEAASITHSVKSKHKILSM